MNKDLRTIWGNKGIRSLLVLTPVILALALPCVMFVAINLLVTEQGPHLPEAIMQMMPASLASATPQAAWVFAFTTLLCPLFFICIPLFCGAASSACVFMGEKESGTLETILLSSMNSKTIYNAKVTCCVLATTILSVISFIVFAIISSVADLLIGAPFFFNLEWLAIVLLVTPGAALFSVTFVSSVINRVHSTVEALQTMGYLLLPFVVLFLIQLTGAIRINLLFILVLAILLLVLGFVLFNSSVRRFEAEKLLTRALEE